MNVLKAKWLSALENAKELYVQGASIFTCDCALNEARRFFELMKEAEVKEKKAEKEAAAKLTFEEVGAEIGRLVSKKNKAYGDSFRKSEGIIDILYENGISLNQYGDLLTVIRIIDKLFRIATHNDPFGEDAWRDIAGYAILKANEVENENL